MVRNGRTCEMSEDTRATTHLPMTGVT